MNVSEMLKARNLPPLRDRKEMLEILLKNEYGYMPELEYEMSVSEPTNYEGRYCDGTVQHSTVEMTITTKYGSHTFPIQRVLHKDGSVNPFFVFLNFRSAVPDRYFPTEEVADAGFDVLMIKYTDIASDNGDFSNGLPKIFMPEGQQKDTDCGKIMFWAWAAMRVLDYAATLPMLDMSQAAVAGHSRLGKTALLTGALDERFRYAFSNCSGCSGASLARGNTGLDYFKNWDIQNPFDFTEDFTTGETIRDILKNFPFWFCKNYQNYLMNNYPDDFDQHYLVASVAPRFAYIASASRDRWADPVSEFLSGVAASEAYEKMGLPGLVHNEKLPEINESLHEGRIGNHLHKSPHFLSRFDWQNYIAFIRKHQFD